MTTLEEVEACDKEILTPADIAPIIGSDPQWIRATARESPEDLGFPVILIGSRVKIPRRPFLAFMKGWRYTQDPTT